MTSSSIRLALAAAATAFALTVPADAGDPCFQISFDKPIYKIDDIGTLHVDGPAGMLGVVLFDTVPGPLPIQGIGVLGVGLSPNLAIQFVAPLPECGGVDFLRQTFPCDTLEIANPLYTQGVGVNPSTGAICVSNLAILNVLDLDGACGCVHYTGCTPGYWKNHTNKWGPTGLHKDDDFDTVFGVDAFDPNVTLKGVLTSGPTYKNLSKHAVAALLNSLHPAENYPYSSLEVIEMTRQAILSGDAKLQESVKDVLATANELGCPF